MSLYKFSLVVGGLSIVLAACATATPEPTARPEATAVPAATQEEDAQEFIPSVTVGDQKASEGAVTIDEVIASQPGWLVIHATRNGGPGPVIGFSPVVVGSNPDLAVDIDLSQATGQLFAMLHVDAGQAGEYEFPGDDAPVFDQGGNVVLTPFTLLDSQAPVGGEEVEVEVVDSTYRLQVVTVPVGTIVTWVYNGGLPHTVTSDTNLFNSGTMREGDSFTFTFDEAGTFPYFCTFHGSAGGNGMSGVINVTEG